MGIKNLHAALKHLKRDVHLVNLPAMRVAVDASSFMVKGGVRHARAYFAGTLTRAPWAEYCLDIAILLREHGMIPVFVFDGERLPFKEDTCVQRREAREKAKEEALELEKIGLIDMAEKKWQGAFLLEQHMEDETMDTLVTNDVVCCTSAYESDQQMATLWKDGVVDAVVTEDSDLLAYGVKRCIFKLKADGWCEYYDASPLSVPPEEPPPAKKSKVVDVMLHELTDTKIAQMCVLSGTDYNKNVQGKGIKKVYSMIRDKTWDECVEILGIGATLLQQMTNALRVFLHPEEYTKATIWKPLKDTMIL